MRTIPIPHLVTGVACASLFVVALIFVPDERLAKLAKLAGRILEDPAGAVAAVSLVAGAITTLRAAWVRVPPSETPRSRPTIPPGATMALALSLALATQGCGASALRMHSTAASIASATIGDLDVRVAGACGVALSSCRGEAVCREETAERCRVAAHAAEGLVASVRAYHDGITAATYADEGEVLPALMAAWRGIRDAWPAIRAALTAIGLDVSWTPEAL